MKTKHFFSIDRLFSLILIMGFMGLVTVGCTTTPTTPSQRSPSRDIETDQFTKGVLAFEGGRYRDAATLFREIIASYPGSTLLMEAQWHLAKSYVAMEQKDWARRELNLFIKNYRQSRYNEEAQALLLALDQPELNSEKVVAAVWSPVVNPRFDSQLFRQNYPGINTIILDIPDEQLKKAASGILGPLAEDRLYEWIRSVQQERFRVVARISLRTMRWAILDHPDWRDQRYNMARGGLETTNTLDLFHPEVKRMLLRLCQSIAEYPVDGIYIEQVAYGVDEGGTTSAQNIYYNLFSERLELTEAFRSSLPHRPTSAQFWRFAGLKSRYLAGLLDEIQTATRKVRPQVQLGIHIPDLLLVDPLDGLVQSSLDYLQLKEARFDFYVVTAMGASREKMYASLQKYGATHGIWIEWHDTENMPPLAHMPVQGIVVSSR